MSNGFGLYGFLDPVTGHLSDISNRLPGTNDVPLLAIPDPSVTPLPWGYDSVNQVATSLRRVPRTMYAIAHDIFALTGSLPTPAAGTQKANLIADLFGGSTPKWQLDAGPNTAALSAVYAALTASNGLATFNAAQQLIMAAMYSQDNPTYLVHPTFDSTINVAGDQPG